MRVSCVLITYSHNYLHICSTDRVYLPNKHSSTKCYFHTVRLAYSKERETGVYNFCWLAGLLTSWLPGLLCILAWPNSSHPACNSSQLQYVHVYTCRQRRGGQVQWSNLSGTIYQRAANNFWHFVNKDASIICNRANFFALPRYNVDNKWRNNREENGSFKNNQRLISQPFFSPS